jgi:hypothetical protein
MRSNEPVCSETSPKALSVGRLLTRLRMPPGEAAPYRIDAGPVMISARPIR